MGPAGRLAGSFLFQPIIIKMKIKLIEALMFGGIHHAADSIIEVEKSLAEELVYLKRATLDLAEEPTEEPTEEPAVEPAVELKKKSAK